jgi:2-polyprenyl-3-methyl-5-hydroxy-6-metoxy-1,4-benzoquinol methylase
MTAGSASKLRDYYEAYWRFRIRQGRVHTLPESWVPQRVAVAARMAHAELCRRDVREPKVLDIGCGEGTLGKLLGQIWKKPLLLHGIDLSTTVLDLARAHYTETFHVDVETEAWSKGLGLGPYDAVVSLDVLEHLLKPAEVLKEVYKILKEDGILIASFPNIAWYRYRVQLLFGQFPEDYLFGTGDHIQQFTLPSFSRLLHRTGFRPAELDGQFILPKICRPARLFMPILKKFPNLFGYQLVIKARKKPGKTDP